MTRRCDPFAALTRAGLLWALALCLLPARPARAGGPLLEGEIRALAISGDRVAALRGGRGRGARHRGTAAGCARSRPTPGGCAGDAGAGEKAPRQRRRRPGSGRRPRRRSRERPRRRDPRRRRDRDRPPPASRRRRRARRRSRTKPTAKPTMTAGPRRRTTTRAGQRRAEPARRACWPPAIVRSGSAAPTACRAWRPIAIATRRRC